MPMQMLHHGHVGFYCRFIKGFSKISHQFLKLLKKEIKFALDDACLGEFSELKEKLVSAHLNISPDWRQPFGVMCDASCVVLCVVLG